MSSDEGWTVVTHKKPTKPKDKKSKPTGPVSESYNQAEGYPSFGHQDWKDVTFRKRKPPPKVKKQREHIMSDEQRRLARIDHTDDVERLKKVKPELSRKIQEYRRAHRLTQTDLAKIMNLKVDVINSYEKGTAFHDPGITSKFHRVFNQRPR